MSLHLPIVTACAVLLLAACSAGPESANPAVQTGGAFPNLASVPARPALAVSMAERQLAIKTLQADNAAAISGTAATDAAGFPVIPLTEPTPPAKLPVGE